MTSFEQDVENPKQEPRVEVEDESEVVASASSEDDEDPVKEEAPEIPTKWDLFFDFNGSLGFVVGSSGFIVSTYVTNWYPHFRYGCVIWVWGCIFYSIPIMWKFNRGCSPFPWSLADVSELCCYIAFILGCILGGFVPTAEVALDLFGPINAFFVAGSFFLTLDPLWEVFRLVFLRKGSLYTRLTHSKLLGTGGKDGLELQGDRSLELFATCSFCAAGVAGGYGSTLRIIQIGIYFWEVGSIFSFFRSVLMWYNRRKALAFMKASDEA